MARHRKNPAAAALGRRRWKGVPKDDRARKMGELSANRWEGMTEEERSVEMKRRKQKQLLREEGLVPTGALESTWTDGKIQLRDVDLIGKSNAEVRDLIRHMRKPRPVPKIED